MSDDDSDSSPEFVDVIRRLRGNDPRLTTLDLRLRSLKPEVVVALAKALQLNTVLTKLTLYRSSIKDAGAVALARALKVNKTLTSLSLRVNSIGDAGAIALAKALKVNTALTSLDLGYNQIDDDGATALAEAIKVNTVLTTLDLRFNHIDDDGATALAGAIKVNTALTSIDLRYNAIGDEGATALAKALKINTALTTLDIGNNHIGGATALADALKVNKVLTHLDLTGNVFKPAGEVALAKVMPYCSLTSFTGVQLRYHCAALGLPSHLAYSSNKNILLFLRSRSAASRWNRCRIMLVGETNVGKTFLRHRLVEPACDLQSAGKVLASTDGVDVDHFDLPVRKAESQPAVASESSSSSTASAASSSAAASAPELVPIRCSVWDFAGQASYYATHHAFLANECIYLVCFNTREWQKNWSSDRLKQETKIAYWLHSIQSHAPGAHIVLVGTQACKDNADLNEESDWWQRARSALVDQFPDLRFHGIVPVLAGDKGDARVETELKGKIRGILEGHLRNVQSDYPPALLELAKQLEQRSETVGKATASSASVSTSSAVSASPSLLFPRPIISTVEFDRTLTELGLVPSQHRSLCLSVFRGVGLLLHFDTDALRDVVFPNPRWVSEQMALLFSERRDKQEMTEGGVISLETLRVLWQPQGPQSSASPAATEALISLVTQFRIGIRLDATTILLPSRMSAVRPEEYVTTNRLTGLLVPADLGNDEDQLQLPLTRLRFEFTMPDSSLLPSHFLEWEGFFTRVQVSLHPMARALNCEVRYWNDGAHLLGRACRVVLDGSTIRSNQLDLVVRGDLDAIVCVVELVQRAIQLELRSSFGGSRAVICALKLVLSSDEKRLVTDVASKGCTSNSFHQQQIQLCRALQPPSQLSTLIELNASAPVAHAAASKVRAPLSYLEERRTLGASAQYFRHAMCEFPGAWHPMPQHDALPLLHDAAIQKGRVAMGWIESSMRRSFDQATLTALPHSNRLSRKQPLQSSQADGPTLDADSDTPMTGEQTRGAGASSDHESSHKRAKTSASSAAAGAVDSGLEPAGAAAAAASSSSSAPSSSSASAPALAISSRKCADLHAFCSSHSDPHPDLQFCSLPFPFSTQAWLCARHRGIVTLMEGQFPKDHSAHPLHAPPGWNGLQWEACPRADAASDGAVASSSMASSSAQSDSPYKHVQRAALPRTDPLYQSVLAAFKRSTLISGVRVTRVFALRSAFSLSRITNLEKKLRLENKESFHNLHVQDWTEPPAQLPHNASQNDSRLAQEYARRHTLMRRLLAIPPPAFRPVPDVTGVVQVFHGCFNEHGALTIANSGFTNKKLSDVGFFGSGPYATSMPDYAAQYPTMIKGGAKQTAAHEFCIIGALGLLGKIRPIVHDQADYNSDGQCEFSGKPLDRGYHTHYVSVDASEDYEAFKEASNGADEASLETNRADEFVFANDSQLHPNLLIYFTWKGPNAEDSDEHHEEEDEEQGEEEEDEKDQEEEEEQDSEDGEENGSEQSSSEDSGEASDSDESSAASDESSAASSAVVPVHAAPSSAAASSSSSHPFPASLASLQVSADSLGGSGDAQLLEDPLSHRRYVLKYESSELTPGATISRAGMEFIANRVYARMGINVAELCLYDPKSRKQVAAGSAAAFAAKPLLLLSQLEPNLTSVQRYLDIPIRPGGRSLQLDDPTWVRRRSEPGDLSARFQSVRSAAVAGFLVDCLLVNWDVCGWMFDNLVVDPSGRVWRLDQGGCCVYRAKGTLKTGDQWGSTVHELHTLRTAALNPNTHLLFSDMDVAELERQVALLAANKAYIISLLPPAATALHGTMVARLDFLISGKWKSTWNKNQGASASGGS